MNENFLSEYLVKLGFTTDRVGLSNFKFALHELDSIIDRSSFSIAKKMIGAGAVITSGFAAAGLAAIGLADKIAMQDQEYRMLALRMYTTTGVARTLKIAMDELGQPLENIAWDPELARRFTRLVEIQQAMMKGMGGEEKFEKQMLLLRDLRFQFTQFKVESQFLLMSLVEDFEKISGLSGEQLLAKLQKWNDWIVVNLPHIRDIIESYLKQPFADMREVLRDAWEMMKLFSASFTNLVGLLSGDKSIQGTEFSFDKLAKAIDHTIHWMAEFAESVIHSIDTVIHAVNALVDLKEGKFSEAKNEIDQALGSLTPGAGAVTGAAVGAPIAMEVGGLAAGPVGAAIGAATGYGAGKIAQQYQKKEIMDAAGLAQMKTGIPASLFLDQWAHETGGFQHIAAPHNLAGIKIPGTDTYQGFTSFDEFASREAAILNSKRYAGLKKPETVEQFAAFLKSGGYYQDTLENYQLGMERFAKTNPSYFAGTPALAAITPPKQFMPGTPSYHEGTLEQLFNMLVFDLNQLIAGGALKIPAATAQTPSVQNHYTFGDTHVNVTQPGASAEEIAKAVDSEHQKKINRQMQRNYHEFSATTPAAGVP